MLATTYKLIENYGSPGIGMTLEDVFYNWQGRQPFVNMQKAGDFIDLIKVDIPSFCRSATKGLIQKLLNQGVLTVHRQEVPEWCYNRLQEEMSFARNPSDTRPREFDIVTLEPGVQIAIHKKPDPPRELPKPPMEEVPEESVGLSPVAGQDIHKEEESEGASTQDPDSAEGETKEWKVNKDWPMQLAFIQASEDPKFLHSVAEDKEESGQFRKLAKFRLSQLSAPVGGKK